MVLNNLTAYYKQLLKDAQEDNIMLIYAGLLHFVVTIGILGVLMALFCGTPNDRKVSIYCSKEYPEVAQELCRSTFTQDDVETIRTGQDKETKERKLKALEILKGEK